MDPLPIIRPMIEADLPAARALWAAAEGVELAEGDGESELTARALAVLKAQGTLEENA